MHLPRQLRLATFIMLLFVLCSSFPWVSRRQVTVAKTHPALVLAPEFKDKFDSIVPVVTPVVNAFANMFTIPGMGNPLDPERQQNEFRGKQEGPKENHQGSRGN